jgi:hypothetical protein
MFPFKPSRYSPNVVIAGKIVSNTHPLYVDLSDDKIELNAKMKEMGK